MNANNGIPNNPDLPALIYPQALGGELVSGDIIALYAVNHWDKAWVYGIFDFHHYHYAAHEVLAVIAGQATLQLGGQDGPCHEVREGDVVILPAGFGHRLVEATRGFTVVGAYPEGQEDIGFARPGDGVRLSSREAARVPASDPIYGADGPLGALWHSPR
ncbi:cupin [Denitrobaculum tricleocarpae]|uniref:Cupin n=1 Tax=Denitrobaculum tricleocarpae TaxID=2591009 RepID=A0A545TUV6_9PROT|nr:cupin [Denitrobaculum tricleocarpae]